MSLSPKVEIEALEAYNILDSCEIIVLLVVTIVLQIHAKIYPGSYGFLKQMGLMLLAFGLLMNLRFGLRVFHYLMGVVGSLFTAIVCLCQFYLSSTDGHEMFLKLPDYVWYFFTAAFFLFSALYGIYFRKQYPTITNENSKLFKIFTNALLLIYLCLSLFNVTICLWRNQF